MSSQEESISILPQPAAHHANAHFLSCCAVSFAGQSEQIAFDGPRRTVIDGPFAEPRKLVADFWLWEVEDMAEAVEWVKRCPTPCPARARSRSARCSTPQISAKPSRRRSPSWTIESAQRRTPAEPVPQRPEARVRCGGAVLLGIWKFSPNKPAAKSAGKKGGRPRGPFITNHAAKRNDAASPGDAALYAFFVAGQAGMADHHPKHIGVQEMWSRHIWLGCGKYAPLGALRDVNRGAVPG
jgi:hypothetical protein